MNPIQLALLTTITLHWTNPMWLAGDVCQDDFTKPAHLTQTLIQYAYVGGDGVPRLLRSHPATAGVPDTAMVPSAPAATYFIVPANDAGPSTCQAASQTVGTATVDVPGVPEGVQRWRRSAWQRFDIQGRRMEPDASGIYFGARDTTVLH